MRTFLLIVSLFIVNAVHSQQPVTKVYESISSVSQDRNGRLYVGQASGDILKLDEHLEVEAIYSPDKPSAVTLIDATNSLRLFAYYSDLQDYVIIDRFLTESARYSLSDYAGFASVIAPSQNNKIWIFDLQTFSIIKSDPLLRQVDFTIPLEQVLSPGNYDISYMQEYQNLLFAADKEHGLLIFDNMGNLLDQVSIKGISHFSFNGDFLLIPGKESISEYNIYSRKQSEYSLPETVDMVFPKSDGYWIIQGNTITTYLKK